MVKRDEHQGEDGTYRGKSGPRFSGKQRSACKHWNIETHNKMKDKTRNLRSKTNRQVVDREIKLLDLIVS